MKIKNKSILMLHSSSDIYGASKIFHITVSILKEQGYNVTVILSDDGPLVEQFKIIGIDVEIIRLGILRRKYFNLKGLINRIIVLKKAYSKLIKIVKDKHVDIIYSNTTGVLVGAFVAKKCSLTHIWHIHEIIEKPALFSNIIGRIINNYSSRVIVVSNEVKKYWQKHVETYKIITIYNGMDYSQYFAGTSLIRQEIGIEKNDVLIGMVARVNAWKGQKYFLQIATKLVSKYNDVKFVIVGDPYPGYEYLQKELHQIIEQNNLHHLVFDLGFRSDIPNILRGLDIFVLPSILPDPLPTVVLEAMASGKPVIATMHGGALEMVEEGITGLLIPWNNSDEASEKFDVLLNDTNVREEMGRRGSERALTLFSKKQYESNIISLVEKTLN